MTEMEQRWLNFETKIYFDKTKKDIQMDILFVLLEARDGDRTRDPLLGKEMLHRWATRAHYIVHIELVNYIKSFQICQ